MNYNRSWDGVFNPGKADDFFQSGCMPFVAGKGDFFATNGWWLAEISRLMYLRGGRNCDTGREQAARNRFLHRVGLEESWYYNGRLIQCAIIRSLPGRGEPFGVLVFRGTRRGLSNWWFLLDFLLADWSAGGRVHRGFKRVLLDAWEHISLELESISAPIFFTGHSLGGALAVLAATLASPVAVYTFGCPRFVDPGFIAATNHLKIYRVVNPTDIVASIPPLPGFKHVGETHILETEKQAEPGFSMGEAPTFLADHSPANYSLGLGGAHHQHMGCAPRNISAVFPKC